MEHDFEKLEHNIQSRMGFAESPSSQEECEISKWDEWDMAIHNGQFPDAFGFLQLAKDSGFSEVKELYHYTRWASAAMLLSFVVFNVVSVIRLDYAFISDPHQAATKLGTQLETIDKFYFTRLSTEVMWPHLARWIGLDSETPSPSPVQVIGFLELLGLTFFLFDLLYCCGMAAHADGFRKWYAIQRVAWDILPTLSVYSAMRLLNKIVPAVITAELKELGGLAKEELARSRSLQGTQSSKVALVYKSGLQGNKEFHKTTSSRGNKRSILSLVLKFVLFAFTLLFSATVGFDTFLMKLRVVSAAADKRTASIHAFVCTIQFLVQLLGVVRLGYFVRRRLFVFIFGGEDGVLQEHEIVLMDTWNALLAKRMHKELSLFEFMAVILTFSDEDFQSLVFNEEEQAPAASIPVHSTDKRNTSRNSSRCSSRESSGRICADSSGQI